jgi:hypothetical protein
MASTSLAMIDEGFVEDQAGVGLCLTRTSALDPKTAALLQLGAAVAIVASVPERGRRRLVPSPRRWVLRPGPAGRRDSWGQDACLEGGLLKDEHHRVFLYVGCC